MIHLKKADYLLDTSHMLTRELKRELNKIFVENKDYKNLYVTDTWNVPLKTAIQYNSETHEIEIEPLEAYAKDSSYILHISKGVRSAGGQYLKSDIALQFRV